MNEEIYNIEALTKILGLTERTIRQKLSSGELSGYKRFGQWYMLKSDLIEFIKYGSVVGETLDEKASRMLEERAKRWVGDASKLDTVSSSNSADERTVQKYSDLVTDIQTNKKSYSYNQYAERNNVSLSIVKKVRNAMGKLNMV